VAGDVAEGVAGQVGWPAAGQGEPGGQLADGVGGLGTATVAAQGDGQAARFEDVDVGAAAGGVGVGAAAGVPGADADAGQQAGQGLAQGGAPLPDVRKITDARTLRALAHPVRVALIETLMFGGAMTATEAGKRIGESATTCSFHLRQLGRYGFVQEAGGGRGRARPWRITATGMSFRSAHDEPEAEIAAMALAGMLRERQLGRYRTWLETRAAYPRR
jgi:hypothetical protein